MKQIQSPINTFDDNQMVVERLRAPKLQPKTVEPKRPALEKRMIRHLGKNMILENRVIRKHSC